MLGPCDPSAEFNSAIRQIENLRYAGLQFTTFCGFPARKARTFSTAMRMSRARAARVAQALCGVMMQFIARSNGLLAGGGSTERTSRPAPAILLALSASANAGSSTNAPRLVFRRRAVGF